MSEFIFLSQILKSILFLSKADKFSKPTIDLMLSATYVNMSYMCFTCDVLAHSPCRFADCGVTC